MKISMHSMAIETFVPMLRSMAELIDKGAAHAREKKIDPLTLANGRLAPDMFTLIQQVQQATNHAKDSTARLTGSEAPKFDDSERTLDDLKARIAKTIEYLNAVGASAFEGAEDREVKIPVPNVGAIEMNGLQYLRDWAIPHFYFHVVTGYDILRNAGVQIGKRDYLSNIGRYIRPPQK